MDKPRYLINFMRQLFYISFLSFLVLIMSCQDKPSAPSGNLPKIKRELNLIPLDTAEFKLNSEWNKYWYAGNAEITSYHLKQSRYGEIHEGTLVNIFVTEDFSKTKQVKLDEPEDAGSDRIKILKLNQSLKFVTGIYPYSMMLSTFSPLDINRYPHAIKITASAQEWCGQSFFQLNNSGGEFLLEQRSYFEKENDHDLNIPQVVLEDELWNRLRLDPMQMPIGKQQVLPGALYFRLSHKPLKADTAELKLTEQDSTLKYSISYPELNRQLEIRLEKKFPYAILSWMDTFPGIDGKVLTTTATRNRTIMLDYWNKHGNVDRELRAQLGLQPGLQ